MRLVFCLAALCGLLVLAGCGGSSKTTGPALTRAKSTETLVTVPKTTSTSSTGTGAKPQKHGAIPSVNAVAAACSGLGGLGSGTSGASALSGRLASADRAIESFVAMHAPGNLALSERLRAKNLLVTMQAAQTALQRYLTAPTPVHRAALVKAVRLEAQTARAETLPECAIRSS